MTFHRLGFWTFIVMLMVDFGQVHRIIPGFSHLFLGALSEGLLFILVLMELPRQGLRWIKPIVFWRVLFLTAVATGLVIGVTQGRVLIVLKTEAPRFLTAFLGAIFFVRRVEDLRILHNVLIAMAFMISGWVLAHHGHGPGLYIDENDVALVLVMLLPFSYLKIFGERSSRKIAVALAVFFITLTAIGLTLSRGGMVGTIPALTFCWLKSRNKVIGLGLAVVALAGALVFAPKDFTSEFESISKTDEGTAEARRYYWDLSVQMFEVRPIFGVGASCWGNALYGHLIHVPDRRAHMTPHSIYFQCLTELGVVGVFCWFGFLVATGRSLRELRASRLNRDAGLAMPAAPDAFALIRMQDHVRFMRNFTASLAIGIAGYLVSGAFLSELFYPGMTLFAALAQASGESWRNELIANIVLNRHAAAAPNRETASVDLSKASAIGTE